MSLEEHVKEREYYGSERVNLSIQQMPDGYAILLNDDRTRYYWLCQDGREGPMTGIVGERSRERFAIN